MSSSPPPEASCLRAVRVQRWVKVGRESAIPRSVLASSAAAAETLSKAPSPFYPHTRTHTHTHHTHTTSYALLSLIAKPRRGVNLFLAAPIIDAMPAPAHESGGGVRLIAHATERVVIKVILLCSPPDRQRAMAELSALQAASLSSSHSTPKTSDSRVTHVLPLLEAMWGVNHLYMVMPWASGGDLCERILSSGRGLPHEEVRRYFTHMVKGLMHLHSCGMAHGDVSPENVVLTRCPRGGEPVAQLIDLGSCVVASSLVASTNKGRRRNGDPSNDEQDREEEEEEEEGLYPFRGKPSYIPVEAVYPGIADDPADPYAVDVWGLGICLYVLLTGRPLYSSPDDPAMGLLASGCAARLLAHYAEFGLQLDPLAQDLIISTLHPMPSKRPSLDHILDHAWLRGINVNGGQNNPPTHHTPPQPHTHAHTHTHTDDVPAQAASRGPSSVHVPTRVQARAHAQAHTGFIAGSPPACVGGVWGGSSRGSGRGSSGSDSSRGTSGDGGGCGGDESDTTSITTNAQHTSIHRSGTTTSTATTTTTAIAARLSQHVRGTGSVSYTTTTRSRCAPLLVGSPVGAFQTSRFDFRCVTDELLAANADDAVVTDEDMPVQAKACRA